MDEEVARRILEWREQIAQLPDTHVAIEALWDGDTDGWCLDVNLISARSDGSFHTRRLQTLRYGGDFRLFDGSVPPWPEAQVAQRAGQEVARALGLELYFPSPSSPDDDCPRFAERNRATPCRICGKLLVSAEVCVACRLDEEQRNRLLADTPGYSGNRAVYLFVEENRRPTSRLFLNLGHSLLVPELAALLARRKLLLSERSDTRLTSDEIAALSSFCENAVDARFQRYQPRADLPDHFALPTVLRWRGAERTVQLRFNQTGSEISSLVHYHRFLAEAHAPVQLLGNGGVSYRDVDFLSRAASRGSTSGAELCASYPFLSADAIELTLKKLEERGFIFRERDEVRLSARGLVVDVAGP